MAPNKSTKNGTTNHNNNNNNSSGSSTSSKKQQPQKQIKIKRPKKAKNRDSDCCSINFIKYVLIIIDIIFFVSRKIFLSQCFSMATRPRTMFFSLSDEPSGHFNVLKGNFKFGSKMNR